MRNQPLIARSSYPIVPGLVLVLLMISVVTDDWRPFLWDMVLIAIACVMAALVNLAVFPLLFRLLARLTNKQRAPKPDAPNDQA